jgi:hypothetical protein
MSRKLVVSAVTAAALVGVTLAAPAAGAATHGRGVTKVHASAKHTVTVPKTLRPGVVHLRNTGSRALFVFGRKKEGTTALAKYLNSQSEKTAKKAFTRFDFVEIVKPHTDDYVGLKRGTYYLADASVDRVKASRIRSVTVSGKVSNAKRPAVRTVTYGKHGLSPLAANGPARGYLRVRNNGTSPLVVETLRVKASATAAQVAAVVNKPTWDGVDKVADYETVTVAGYLGARHDVTTTASLRSGRYLVLALDVFHFGVAKGRVAEIGVR